MHFIPSHPTAPTAHPQWRPQPHPHPTKVASKHRPATNDQLPAPSRPCDSTAPHCVHPPSCNPMIPIIIACIINPPLAFSPNPQDPVQGRTPTRTLDGLDISWLLGIEHHSTCQHRRSVEVYLISSHFISFRLFVY